MINDTFGIPRKKMYIFKNCSPWFEMDSAFSVGAKYGAFAVGAN